MLIKFQISRLSNNERKLAEREFYTLDKAENMLAGTIAKINPHGEGGVFIWSNKGFKYFPANQNTVFRYYNVCEAIQTSEGKIQIDRKSLRTSYEISTWSKWIQIGDFIQFIITIPDDKSQVGSLREILAYSLPLFLPFDPGISCQE